MKQEEYLFQKGMMYFKTKDYFQAHEEWEDLWSDYYLEDRKFIQALIQLAVSFYHISNENLNGAKSQLGKSRKKFLEFKDIHRNINVDNLVYQIDMVAKNYNEIQHAKNFDWGLVPTLN
jgi:predicted metal-dependent hydrolase